MATRRRLEPTALGSSPRFAALAKVHGISVAGEAMVALALAGSLFFKVDPTEGREKVLLGLLFTVAPFGLVAPLIGPAIDRVPGGHRVVVVGTMVLRAVLAGAMVMAVRADSLALFPEAFAMLVLAKTYQVAKAALVPDVVESDAELVEANSKLQVLAGVVTIAAGVPGLLLSLIDPWVVLVVAMFGFAAGTVASLALPSQPAHGWVGDGADERASEAERGVLATAELRGPVVRSAAALMATLRGIVGFTTLLAAFELRGDAPTVTERAAVAAMEAAKRVNPRYEVPELGPPGWHFGLVVGLSLAAGLGGAAVAPRLRQLGSEGRLLVGAAAVVGAGAIGSALIDGLVGLLLLSCVVAAGAATAKQAFDALVQQGAPDADRGRLFARFEARFQLAWVLGALAPVALTMPTGFGAWVVAICAATAVVIGVAGIDRVRQVVRSGAASLRSRPTDPGG